MPNADRVCTQTALLMSAAMQESGKKDRIKESLSASLEACGWREAVRQAANAVIAETPENKLSAKEIASAVRANALRILL
jgi:Transcription factor e(y)2